MDTSIYPYEKSKYAMSDEINWAELYPRLRSLSRCLVYRHRIPYWFGQEEEIAEDVAAETVKRFIERSRKAARGEAAHIDAPQQMMVTIALNYIRDLLRREHRLIRQPREELTHVLRPDRNNCLWVAEVATENIYHEQLFLQLAQEIAHFPSKQLQALLVDLANRMHFSEQPTSLQAAFLAVGIDLQTYQQLLSDKPEERARHAALLYWAYRRLIQLAGNKL